jgi:hypothetical protein
MRTHLQRGSAASMHSSWQLPCRGCPLRWLHRLLADITVQQASYKSNTGIVQVTQGAGVARPAVSFCSISLLYDKHDILAEQ